MFDVENFYIKNLIIEKNDNYVHNYHFLRDKKVIFQTNWNFEGWFFNTVMTQDTWNQTLITKINKISAVFHNVDWIISSLNINFFLKSFNSFNLSEAYGSKSFINYCGNLTFRYDVYLNEKLPNDLLFCGNDKVFSVIKVNNLFNF